MISLSKSGNSYNKILLRIDGLSSETKPAQFVNEFDNDNRLIKSFYIPNGSSFVEIDTGKEFLYDEENAEWYEFNGDSSGSEYAHSLELAINSQTYVLTATLKNTDGDTLGTPQTIDLPLETMVVGGSYDDNTKKIILTLKNGETVEFSVADLVDGFLTEEEYNAGKTIPSGTTYTIGGTTYTVGDNAEVFNDYSNNKAIGNYSHAEGSNTRATGNYSHAEGYDTFASGAYSHAECGNNTGASGDYSHAEGSFCRATGYGSHAEGGGTIANGTFSHSCGNKTLASSDYQCVQGKYNIEDANSKYAFIIGNGTFDNARSNAFAVDWDGLIYVNNSATGVDVSDLLTEEIYNAGKQVTANDKTGEIFNDYTNNKATGNYSHAEGYNAKSTGNYSHSEGNATSAYGTASHTEGFNTTANGFYSHAEGSYTIARGDRSHAEGGGTIAASIYQHVQGKYNAEDSNSKYAFIIGNGTDNNNRSNAFAVDWNGKIYVNNAVTGVDVSTLQSTVTDIQTTIGNINAVLEEVL